MILKRKRRIPIYFRMGFGISKQVTISERHKEKYRWVIQLRLSYGKTLLSWLINLFASKSPGFFKKKKCAGSDIFVLKKNMHPSHATPFVIFL